MALEGGEGSASRPGRSLPPGKTRYPFYRRLCGPQGRSGQVRKISPKPGFGPQTVQPRSQSLYQLSYSTSLYIFSPKSCDISSKVEAIPGFFPLNVRFGPSIFFDRPIFLLAIEMYLYPKLGMGAPFIRIAICIHLQLAFCIPVHLHETSRPRL